MRRKCSAHRCVSVFSALAWAVVCWLMWLPPGPEHVLRLPFFAVLGAAVGATSLSLFPLVMRGYLVDVVLAYTAGYNQREADDERAERPPLTVVR